ncbi:MAG: DUF2927 domain-containing protein [Dongiaceae bacterium]
MLKILLGMICCHGAGGAAARADGDLTNAQASANLIEIMFGSEFVGEATQIVRKWTGPMRIAIYALEPERYRALVEGHLGRLRQLTGLAIELVDNKAAGQNAYVLIVGRSQFYDLAERHLGPGKNPRTNTYLDCFGYFYSAAGSGEISELTAVMPNFATNEQLRQCVIEEITQAIGLPNDSFTVRPSVFNDDDQFPDLTWQDELFLRMLYDPRVKPGMSRRAFEPLAHAIIEELRPGL